MTMWQDVAPPRVGAYDRRWFHRLRPRPELPPHPLESRRLAARRSAAQGFARRAIPVAVAAAAAAGAAWGGLHLGKRLPFFRVDRVEVGGGGRLTPDQVRAAAGVTGAVSVWEDRARMAARLEEHPLVESARIERSLPATLVIEVEEAAPVGLVASPVVVAVNRNGDPLPLDPTAPILDLPLLRVVNSLASASWGMRILARDVAHVADVAPEVFAVLSEARLDDREATLLLGDAGLRVRYHPPISQRRLREAVMAMNDAHRRIRQGGLAEIDMRFADQVVVRVVRTPVAPAPGAMVVQAGDPENGGRAEREAVAQAGGPNGEPGEGGAGG